jgi:hypothetical protein
MLLQAPRFSTYRAIRRAHTLGWKTGLYAGIMSGVAVATIVCAVFVSLHELRGGR